MHKKFQTRLSLISILRGAFTIAVLLSFAICCNILQTASLLLYPVSKRLFRSANEALSKYWWSLNYTLSLNVLVRKFIITGADVVPDRENAIVIANHQAMTDILLICALAEQKKTGAHIKFFAKDALRYAPFIGLGMHLLNYIFLKRNWFKDANSILSTFSKLRDNKIKFWLVNFPEGTRASPAKITTGQNFAKQKGLPILKSVLTPRTKGVTSTIQGLRGHFSAVYDFTIYYPEGAPNLAQFYFCQLAPLHMHVERIPAQSLPATEPELQTWLHERFLQKDRRLQSMQGANI
jgi:1-acyl-sn-glycerol-3-phosphate acyltransferase